jgi:hypothetical protein
MPTREEFIVAYLRCWPESDLEFAGYVYDNLNGPDDKMVEALDGWMEELSQSTTRETLRDYTTTMSTSKKG